MLYAIAVLQALVMVAALHAFNGFDPARMGQTLLVACVASVTFMSVMYFFTNLMGKVGSFLMLVFMVVQLAGSVGTYPLELSGSFVPYLHDWVPFTYSVTAFRRAICGGQDIGGCLAYLAVWLAVFTLLTIVVFVVRAKRIRAQKPTLMVWLNATAWPDTSGGKSGTKFGKYGQEGNFLREAPFLLFARQEKMREKRRPALFLSIFIQYNRVIADTPRRPGGAPKRRKIPWLTRRSSSWTTTKISANCLRLYLVKEGYSVTIANDGKAALAEFEKLHPDLVLLDVMMPVMDGWEVCRKIRAKDNTPIIMLTAKGETYDKVLGLELGADDYIVKPFDAKEVTARIKAVLRRSAKEDNKGVYDFDNLHLDMNRYELKVKGKGGGSPAQRTGTAGLPGGPPQPRLYPRPAAGRGVGL